MRLGFEFTSDSLVGWCLSDMPTVEGWNAVNHLAEEYMILCSVNLLGPGLRQSSLN